MEGEASAHSFTPPLVVSAIRTTRVSGWLTLIIGCMFSGKSTELVRLLTRYSRNKQKTVMIKWSGDDRSAHNETTSTHDSVFASAIAFPSIAEAVTHARVIEASIIGIDEGQFFSDIEKSLKWVLEGKIVIIAALDSDHKAEPFGSVNRLFHHADTITKLKAICSICCGDAIHTKKHFEEDKRGEIIDPGAEEKYTALCRDCYYGLR